MGTPLVPLAPGEAPGQGSYGDALALLSPAAFAALISTLPGGGPPTHEVQLTLDNAAILTLGSVGTRFLPSNPGKFLIPLTCLMEAKIGATAYTTVAGGPPVLLDNASNGTYIVYAESPFLTSINSDFMRNFAPSFQASTASGANAGAVLSNQNQADYTDGDPASTLRFTMIYLLYNPTTGLFV